MDATDEAAGAVVTAMIMASAALNNETLAMGPKLFVSLENRGEIVTADFRCVSSGATFRLPTYRGHIVWKAHELGVWECEIEAPYA